MDHITNNTHLKIQNAKNIKNLFQNVLNKLEEEQWIRNYINEETAFTRKRILTSSVVVKLLFARVFLSLSCFLCFQFSSSKNRITKQAFSKARKQISHLLFQQLNSDLIQEFYQSFRLNRFQNKYLLFAIDGTTLEIPNTKHLREIFGHTQGQKGAKQIARASASCIYDVWNHLIVSSRIDCYSTSEREMAIEMMDEIREKECFLGKELLYLMDRGYYSFSLLTYFLSNHQKFLFRVKKSVLQKYFKQTRSEDIVKEVDLTRLCPKGKEKELEKLGNKTLITLRFTKVLLSTGEEEYLLSNVEDIPLEELKQLYFQRWNIEENYKFLKHKMDLENFSGKTKNTVLQDFYSAIINANIQQLIAQCVKKKETKKGTPYQVNQNLLVGFYRREIAGNILKRKSLLLHRISKIIRLLSDIPLVTPPPNRSFPRNINDRVRANLHFSNYRPA